MDSVAIYKAKKSMLWAVFGVFLLVFLGLTLPRLIEGTLETRHMQGLAVFYLVIFVLGITPFFAKLVVGKDYVKSYYFGLCTANIRASEILVVEYGRLMRFGGLGFGNGLKIATGTQGGRTKYYSIGESLFGADAIKHARQVLEKK